MFTERGMSSRRQLGPSVCVFEFLNGLFRGFYGHIVENLVSTGSQLHRKLLGQCDSIFKTRLMRVLGTHKSQASRTFVIGLIRNISERHSIYETVSSANTTISFRSYTVEYMMLRLVGSYL